MGGPFVLLIHARCLKYFIEYIEDHDDGSADYCAKLVDPLGYRRKASNALRYFMADNLFFEV